VSAEFWQNRFDPLTFSPKTVPREVLVFLDDSGLKKGSRPVKRSRYTNEQIAFALRQAESGTSVGEVC
jgi:hypothetical protein